MLRNLNRFTGLVARRGISTGAAIAEEIKTRGPWYFVNEPLAKHDILKLDASFKEYVPPPVEPRQKGQDLPAGYHLIFHNDVSTEAGLSSDGYHNAQAPDDRFFPARMWLGGTVEFNYESKPLLIDSPSSAKELIGNTRFKSMTNSEGATVERIDVQMERYLYGDNVSKDQMNDSNWALKESRSIGYFSPEASADRKSTFTRFVKRKLKLIHFSLFIS